MRGVAVSQPSPGERATACLGGRPVCCRLVDEPAPAFDGRSLDGADRVLVRKLGFSCNFRDRGLILEVATFAPPGARYVIGSEFVGEVVATGRNVEDLRPGDRVIGDYSYPETPLPGARPGVPSNHTSLEYEAFHRGRLARISARLDNSAAACISIGAQTSYAIARRLELRGGERVLVTAGGSNTSLFVVQALKKFDVQVFATTRRDRTDPMHDRLRALGADAVFQIEPGRSSFLDHPEIRAAAEPGSSFDAVVDPFFDLHLTRAVAVLKTGGTYITCGFLDQTPHVAPAPIERSPSDLQAVLQAVLLKNLRIVGNCSGDTADLEAALRDLETGRLKPVVDTVYSEAQVDEWFERTFVAPDRLGKTPLLYTS